MRWIASCVASLALAACLCGATAMARPGSRFGPPRTTSTNATWVAQGGTAQRPSTHATQTSGTRAPATVLLGYDAAGPAPASSPAGRPESFRFADRRSGSVSSIHVFIASRNRAKSLVAGLYSNANGHPGSLLTVGALNHPKAGAWNALRVRSASVRSGHIYWLAVLGRGGRLYFRAGRNGGCSAQKARQTRMPSLRSSWTGSRDNSLCGISAFAAREMTGGTVTVVTSPVASGASNGVSVVTSPVASGASNGGVAAGSAPNPVVTPPLRCDVNATTSNVTTQITNATAGQVVCLASGDYSGFSGTSKSAPGITITAAPGATVTFNSGMRLNLSSVQNFTLDGTGGGGTMTVGGLLDMETSGDALQNKALNLDVPESRFHGGWRCDLSRAPRTPTSRSTATRSWTGNAGCNGTSATGVTYQFLLPYQTATATTPSGLTIESSVFVAPADLWNPRRAIQTASPMTVTDNVFVGYLDHTGPRVATISTRSRSTQVEQHLGWHHVHRQLVLRRLRLLHGVRRHVGQHDHRQRLLRHRERLRQPLC